jgi:ABC-type uncharacterized transport system involved in gliding motility auxiliary subunit
MMNRTVRTIVAVVFILMITVSLISVCQNIGKGWKVDMTQQQIYSLSDGTRAILGKLNQPLTMKLYYSSTAAIKGPDQIRYFNNYYKFVRSLLEEYVAASNGMVRLEVIDPRPYSDDEVAATRYGLKKFPITQEENFFFGLVIQTQFGVEKTVPFFSPSRQNFIEYDISYLIDTAITRQKKRVGILSSLNILGDDVSPYMARMMQLQGQRPSGPWNIVQQLRQQYEVKKIQQGVSKIEDVDILLVIHPRDFSEQTLFAIDQFAISGGRTLVFIDPFCVADQPKQPPTQMQTEHNPSSNLEKLMVNWGLEMPKDTYAGDRSLALEGALRAGERPQRIIGFLETRPECFNRNTPMTSELNQVRFLYSGVLKPIQMSGEDEKQIERTPLVATTSKGNSWTASQYEVMSPDVGPLMKKFTDGTEPAAMAYLVTGKFKSAFPNGIEIEVDAPENADDANAPKKIKQHIEAIAEAKENCAVAVFADVDFFSDMIAYSETIFGTMVIGDGSNLLLNAIDDFCGSGELISIRSRGNFKRPFTVVDKIEAEAEAQTAQEEAKINAEIAGFESELNQILGSAKQGQEEIVGSSILAKKQELELKILEARKQLKEIRRIRLQRIESLGNKLRNFNMLAAPAVILTIAIVLGIYRGAKKRRYISHASDA